MSSNKAFTRVSDNDNKILVIFNTKVVLSTPAYTFAQVI